MISHMAVKSLLKISDEKVSTSEDSPADLAVRLSKGRWLRARHLEYVSEKIAQIKERPIRLIISMPPRHGKSELCSHYTPVWFLREYPWKRVILASYEYNFAAIWGGKARDTIMSNPDIGISITKDTKAKTSWNITGYGGGMFTAGVGGSITGKGADLLIIDDPVKNAAEAQSIVYREKAWEWYRSTAYTRLEPGASIIIIMTRWHDDDLVGRIIKEEGDNWDYVCLPAIAETNDPIGRSEGEALWPARFPVRELVGPLTKKKPIREIQGTYWWPALYQQRPTEAEGQVFKLDWWQYYKEPPRCKTKIQIWDTAFKEAQTADYSVCLTAGEFDKGYAVLDVWRGRPQFPELERIAKNIYVRDKPNKVGVEDKASGQSLIQVLKRHAKIPIKAIKAKDDKESRAHSITGLCEAGRIWLPEEAPWLQDFLDELSAFPRGAHDDQVDTFVYAILEFNPFKPDTKLKVQKKESRYKERV